jgi:hypothetical protein
MVSRAMTPIATMLEALPTRSEWQAGLDSIRADLRLLAPRKAKPRPVRVSNGPSVRCRT